MERSLYVQDRPELVTKEQPQAAYHLRVLGGFQVEAHGQPITDFGSNKARALLFYLLMAPERAHSRSTLVELFWPERSPRSAFNNLNQTLFMLRRAFDNLEAAPSLIISSRQTIQINPEVRVEVDLISFNQALATSKQLAKVGGEGTSAWLAALTEAVALYQGELLQGFSLPDAPDFDDWLAIQRERCHLALLEALQ
ncbi:AfsR/SARP family transcriptional regulator [Candidatus Viridilinea mediisalina]|nr:winged helix-turn-helix domain-containing protein [Candidatus Viridilinea mediisalina]